MSRLWVPLVKRWMASECLFAHCSTCTTIWLTLLSILAFFFPFVLSQFQASPVRKITLSVCRMVWNSIRRKENENQKLLSVWLLSIYRYSSSSSCAIFHVYRKTPIHISHRGTKIWKNCYIVRFGYTKVKRSRINQEKKRKVRVASIVTYVDLIATKLYSRKKRRKESKTE